MTVPGAVESGGFQGVLRPVELAVPGEGRQQQLLFGAEMTRALPLEEVQKDLARLGRGLPLLPLELQRRERPLVVLV